MYGMVLRDVGLPEKQAFEGVVFGMEMRSSPGKKKLLTVGVCELDGQDRRESSRNGKETGGGELHLDGWLVVV